LRSMDESLHALAVESVTVVMFVFTAIAGFKWNLRRVVRARPLRPHSRQSDCQPGVPVWWPLFCLRFDDVAGAYLATLIVRARCVPSFPPAARGGQTAFRSGRAPEGP